MFQVWSQHWRVDPKNLRRELPLTEWATARSAHKASSEWLNPLDSQANFENPKQTRKLQILIKALLPLSGKKKRRKKKSLVFKYPSYSLNYKYQNKTEKGAVHSQMWHDWQRSSEQPVFCSATWGFESTLFHKSKALTPAACTRVKP